MTKQIAIGKNLIGDDHPVYFVADIAANHDGELQRAKDLIHLCSEAGAHAAKFQNFKVDTIVSEFGFNALGGKMSHQVSWKKSIVEVFEEASLPVDWAGELEQTCGDAGIDYFTTPYDLEIIDELESYVCAWKIGSGDITWHDEIEALARSGKPLLIATGASDIEDVRRAIAIAERHSTDIVLMQCNTNYSGSVDNFRHIALNVLKTFKREFPDVILGLSDHTRGHATVLGAIALGARVVEKHFTDDTGRDGPDHPFSMDPAAWREMVDRSTELELALGPSEKRVMDNETEAIIVQRRAVRAARSLYRGQVVLESDLIPMRPCPEDALPPYRVGELVGKTSVRDIEEGDCVRPSDVY